MNSYKEMDNYFIGYDSHNREFYFDKEDYAKIQQYTWYVHTNGYVRAREKKTCREITFHRFILNLDNCSFPLVDHINGLRFDNRKNNLRKVNYSQNMMNSKTYNPSGFRGIYLNRKNNKWRARICVGGKRISLGEYVDIYDAVCARQEAEKLYYGEYRYCSDDDILLGGNYGSNGS